MVERRNQQVAVGIRKAINNDHAAGCAIKHAQRAIVCTKCRRCPTKKAVVRGTGAPLHRLWSGGLCNRFPSLYVCQSPRRPEGFDAHAFHRNQNQNPCGKELAKSFDWLGMKTRAGKAASDGPWPTGGWPLQRIVAARTQVRVGIDRQRRAPANGGSGMTNRTRGLCE